MHNQTLGILGERYACTYLKKHGFTLIAHNFRTRYGELDVIAAKDNLLLFCEVKTRLNSQKGKPYEAIDYRKIKHLKRAIQYFLLNGNYKNYKLRLDVIGIILKEDRRVDELKHYENVEL